MIHDDQVALEGGQYTGPDTGNKTFDRKHKRHYGAINDFSVRQKSNITTGIIYKRGCTDFFFLIIFIITFLGMFGLAAYALIKGHPGKFIAPYDAAGDMCGYGAKPDTTSLSQYPKLYFTVFGVDQTISDVTHSGVCVMSCPNETQITSQEWWNANCVSANDKVVCPKALVPGKPTPDFPYNSQAIFTYCMPSFEGATPEQQTYYDQLKDDLLGKEAGQALVSLTQTWKTNAVMIITGVIVSILFMWLMSNCARCLALTAVVILFLSFFGGGAACIFFGMSSQTNADGDATKNQALMITGGVMILFGLCTLCALWCNRTSLETAIAIIDASADFLIDTKRLIFVSIFYFFVTMIIFFMWIFACACVFSLSPFEDPKIPGDQMKKIQEPSGSLWGMFAFMAFGMLWTFQFISDKQKFITMVSAATYYFDCNPEKNGSASVSSGFKFAYFNNAGSLALGSLILTIVSILRQIVEQMAQAANKNGDGAAKCIACIAQCLMSCLEAIVEHLTKMSYAYMAVSGESFCVSAWNGFLLNLKHLAKFVFAMKIAGLFVFMGILSITCVNTGIGYLLSVHLIKDAQNIANIVPSLIAFAVVSFIVAIIFLGQFHEAVLATLICFAVDSDLNDGEPKFGPKDYHEKLARIYGKHGQDRNMVLDEFNQPLVGQAQVQNGQQNQMY